jgi:hypothetical protein
MQIRMLKFLNFVKFNENGERKYHFSDVLVFITDFLSFKKPKACKKGNKKPLVQILTSKSTLWI